jgi:hypothetical protein
MSGIISSLADNLALGSVGMAAAGLASLVSFVYGAAKRPRVSAPPALHHRKVFSLP